MSSGGLKKQCGGLEIGQAPEYGGPAERLALLWDLQHS